MDKIYSCLGCGEYFKVELLSGKTPKASPCCGDSVFLEVSMEFINITSDRELINFASK